MNEIRIEGGNPLTGEVRIQGSKNAALPMMAAALLHKGKSVLHHCPKIADVFVMEEILRELGMQIRHEGDTLTLDPAHVEKTEIDCCEGQKMRSSVILLGSLLGRFKNASVPHPGGCVIGNAPLTCICTLWSGWVPYSRRKRVSSLPGQMGLWAAPFIFQR